MTRPSSRHSRITKLLLGGTALILLAGTALVVVSVVGLIRNDSKTTWTGAQRQPAELSNPSAEGTPQDSGESEEGVTPLQPNTLLSDAVQHNTVEIPVLSFSAPMKAMAVGASKELYPPTATDVYWLEEYGSPEANSENTVYLIGHTSQNGSAVFDPLINLSEQATNLLPGDEILLGTETAPLTYQVTETQRYHRTHLASIDQVWEDQPGRLVVITCFFVPGQDVAPDNIVIFAESTTQ